MEHVAEGQENNRGPPPECSRGGEGGTKISQFHNSMIAVDLRRPFTPSSLRYENQVEVHLTLATLRVVLRDQLLVAIERLGRQVVPTP